MLKLTDTRILKKERSATKIMKMTIRIGTEKASVTDTITGR
jgi:hypothetical protein